MLILRLFDLADPATPVDARIVTDEEITIGRDHSADWVISDPDHQISRVHCKARSWNDQLLLTDTSSNGVFLDDGGKRINRDAPIALEPGQRFYFARKYVEISRPMNGIAGEHTVLQTRIDDGEERTPPAAPQPRETDRGPDIVEGALLAAFCRGAGLDLSGLVAEDSITVMERAGAIYREALKGMARLVKARAAARQEKGVELTTIGSSDNNPFKWGPEHNLAIDLLREGEAGFLSGEAAIKSCFRDVETHLLATAGTVDAAALGILDTLAPERIEATIEGGITLKSKASRRWESYSLLHARLAEDAAERRRAYERRVLQQYNDTRPQPEEGE